MRTVIYCQILFCMLFSSVGAQTVLIDPTGAGGFALGATLQSNGWTELNFENKNGWTVGTPLDANKAAFSSLNWEDENPLAGIDASDVGKASHFYRDVTIPAGEDVVELSFLFRMDRGFLTVGVANTDHVPTVSQTSVPSSAGASIYSANYLTNSQTPTWVLVRRFIPSGYAGTTVRLIFTVSYSAFMSIGAQSFGPAIRDISLTSRPPISFESKPGSFNWTNPDAWTPVGVPVTGDDVTIVAGSTINGSNGSVNNLTIAGQLTAPFTTVTGNVLVAPTGRFVLQGNTTTINGNFTVEEGGTVDARNTSLNFVRTSTLPPLQQLFSFHAPQQFEAAAIRGLGMINPEGLRVQSASGRLAVCSLLNMALSGTLVTNDALELNHQLIPNIAYTSINISGSATWSVPVPKAAGAKVGLQYNGTMGTNESPYIMGTLNEWNAGDTLHEFTIGSVSTIIKCPDDLVVAATQGSRFRLFGSLIMEQGKTLIFTESGFVGATPSGFPGPVSSNIFNNAHVIGGAGVAYRLNGSNLNRVWPMGIDGQQFVFGMYGINADNALVRVSMVKSEEGTTGAGISQINPLYRHRVEVIEGTLSKVDSVNLGFNVAISGFVEGDQPNRRATLSSTLNGTFESIGGPTGGLSVQNPFRPEWNMGWVRSNLGNYNTSAYYALGLSTGNFAIMWRNNTGGNYSWDDPANWTGNTTPTATDPVVLNAPGTTITVSQNSTCSQLTVTNGTNVVVPAGVNFEVGGN